MPSTIHDVIRVSGVSLATVSKYLNGKHVKDSTAEKIEAAISKLNYIPNGIARSLVTSKTKTVGIVLPHIANRFASEVTAAFISELKSNGYASLLVDCGGDSLNEIGCAEFLLEKKVDALFSIPLTDDTKLVGFAKSHNIPIVFADHLIQGNDADTVLSDNESAMYNAVMRLYGLGHRKIAMFGSNISAGMSERTAGYVKAMKKLGLYNDALYIDFKSHQNDESLNKLISKLLKKHAPSAMISANYELTPYLLNSVKKKESQDGKPIALLCFDSFDFAEYIYPHITLIHQQTEVIGTSAAKLLLSRMSGDFESFPTVKRVPVQFIEA